MKFNLSRYSFGEKCDFCFTLPYYLGQFLRNPEKGAGAYCSSRDLVPVGFNAFGNHYVGSNDSIGSTGVANGNHIIAFGRSGVLFHENKWCPLR